MRRKFLNSLLCFVLAGSMMIGEARTVMAAGIAQEAEEMALETGEDSQAPSESAETGEENSEIPGDTVDTPEETSKVPEDAAIPEDSVMPEELAVREEPEAPEEPEEPEEPAAPEVPATPKDAKSGEAGIAGKETESDKRALDAAGASKAIDYTPEVKSLNVEWEYNDDGWVTITWRGTGWRFEIFSNGKHKISKYNTGNENEEMNGSYTFSTNLGTTYRVEIIPYSTSGRKGVSKSAVNKREFGSIMNFKAKKAQYDDETERGYSIPGIFLQWDYSGPGPVEYEVWRSTSRDTGYSLIGMVTDGVYRDKGLLPGIYYYKIRLVSRAYQTNLTMGPFSQPVKGEVELVSASCRTALDEKGRVVITCSADKYYIYGYEIYRSTQRNSGYRKIATTSNDTYIDDEAEKGKTYYYKVKGFYYDTKRKKVYMGDYSRINGIKVVKDDFIIEKASAVSASKASIKWSKVSGADEYRIYYRSANQGEKYKLLASTSKTSYTKSGLTSGQTYYFQVHAYRKKKEYAVSDTASVMVGLAEPQNLMLSGRTYEYRNSTYIVKNKLTWDRVYGADGYYLQVDNQGWETVQKLKSSSTSCTYQQIIKSESGQKEMLRLVAYKGNTQYKGDTMELSMEVAPVTGINVKQKGADSAVISWKGSLGAKTYSVYRLIPNEDFLWVGNVDGTSITDTGLKEGINYTYWVKVRYLSNGVENVKYIPIIREGSDIKPFTLNVSKPTITSVKNTNTEGAVIKWSKASKAQRYMIYRSESKSGPYKKIKTVSAKTTSYTDSKLKQGKSYYYKVRAQRVNNIRGEVYSNYSGYKGIKIVLSVAKPSITSIKNVSSKKAVITWKKSATAQRYEIYRSESKKGSYKKIKTVSAKTTAYTDSKLKKGKGYYYKVRAYRVNNSGKKVYSSYSSYKGIKIKK